MSWFSTVPVILVCLVLLFAPGMLVVAALGLRRLAYVAVAPLLTVSLVAATAIVAPYLGVRWSPLPVIGATLLTAGLLFGVRLLQSRGGRALTPDGGSWRPTRPKRAHVIAAVGFVAGAASIGFQLLRAFGRPENISQTFDNVFHLNAVRYIIDSGNASSMTLSSMTSGDGPPYFYPAAWHGLASLLVEITGADISVAVNVLNICIAAAVWTAGCMFLTRNVVGPNAYAVGAAGVLAAGFGAFPLMLLDFGVLYPNFLSVSMLPAALACVSVFFRTSEIAGTPALARYVLAPFAAVGVAISHPNGLMSLLALSIPILLVSYLGFCLSRYRAAKTLRASLLMGGGLLALFAVLAVMWKFIRPPAAAATWMPFQTPGQAVGEILTNSVMLRPPAFAVSILAAAGIVVLFRRHKNIWLLGSFLITAALFVVVSSGPNGSLRNILTGVWYNDSYRLAALLPVTAVPLAAAGAAWLVSKLQSNWVAWRATAKKMPAAIKNSRWIVPAVLPLTLLAVILVSQTVPLASSIQSARKNYSTTPDSALVSSDEMALIDEVDHYVPANATIAVNPWTGGAMAFAIADRNTTSKHTLTTYTASTELLNDKLREASTDPAVCRAARSAGVRYVLDFGTREVHGGNHGFKGLQIPDSTPGFELLAQVGEAKLFELTACN
jgi:hypothetical protein